MMYSLWTKDSRAARIQVKAGLSPEVCLKQPIKSFLKSVGEKIVLVTIFLKGYSRVQNV